MEHIVSTEANLLGELRDGLMKSRVRLYARKIYERGAALSNCVGLIDGTAIKISLPVTAQRACYPGHRMPHCFKFQTICASNSLPSHLFGPLEGVRHNVAL